MRPARASSPHCLEATARRRDRTPRRHDSPGGRADTPARARRSTRGKGRGSQSPPEAPPLAPSGHRLRAGAETPLGLGVPPSAEQLRAGATGEAASTGKAKGATEPACLWSPRGLFRASSSCRFPSKDRVSTSAEHAPRSEQRACAREPRWLPATPAYEGLGGGSRRLRTKARRRPAPAQLSAAETVGSFASPRLARWRVRSLRRRRGRHRSG